MSTPLVQQLIDILNKLDRFVGDYPIFIYLMDRDYNLVWCNHYTLNYFSGIHLHKKVPCYKALWGYEEKCRDCPAIQDIAEKGKDRHVIRRLQSSGDELFLEVLSFPVLTSDNEVEGVLKIGLDVTSIEKEQRMLREKEQLYTSIFNSSADAIFFLDNQDRIMSWNKGAEDIFGYMPEEVIGKSGVLLIPKELIELGEQYYINQEINKFGFIRKYETQRLHKSGDIIYVDLTRTVIRNSEDEPIGSSVIIKDITSRKELEFELRRTIMELSKLNELNEIFYKTYALDDILRMILIAITAGEGLRFNRAFLFLISENQTTLRGHLAVGPENEAEAYRVWSSLQDHFRSLKDIVQQSQINLQGIDQGINKIIRQIQIPIEDEDHILVRSLKNRQAILVNQGNMSDSKSQNLNDANGEFYELLGTNTLVVVPLVTKQDSIGVIVADNKITHRDITEEEIESLKLFANQASMAIENARLYQNLEDRILELQHAYRELEEKSDRLLKAERLATIGEMSAKIAHEIRNPLVSIGGFARLMKNKFPENKELKKYTAIIASQVSNLESILNNILTIANPKKPKRREVDIHQIIHNVLLIMEDVIGDRNIEVIPLFHCRDSAVFGDEKLLYQMILNLVKNALEAMEEQGVLTLKTDCAEDYALIQVQDTGQGIPDENIRKIYDPFFTTKTDGTGLGLPIVRQIIGDHEGKIEFQSIPGKGTTVRIHLPRYSTVNVAELKEEEL